VKKSAQQGITAIYFILLLTVLCLLAFFVLTQFMPFSGELNALLFPKQESKAVDWALW